MTRPATRWRHGRRGWPGPAGCGPRASDDGARSRGGADAALPSAGAWESRHHRRAARAASGSDAVPSGGRVVPWVVSQSEWIRRKPPSEPTDDDGAPSARWRTHAKIRRSLALCTVGPDATSAKQLGSGRMRGRERRWPTGGFSTTHGLHLPSTVASKGHVIASAAGFSLPAGSRSGQVQRRRDTSSVAPSGDLRQGSALGATLAWLGTQARHPSEG